MGPAPPLVGWLDEARPPLDGSQPAGPSCGQLGPAVGEVVVNRPCKVAIFLMQLSKFISNNIQYQGYGLVCEGNPSFESCVEGKS